MLLYQKIALTNFLALIIGITGSVIGSAIHASVYNSNFSVSLAILAIASIVNLVLILMFKTQEEIFYAADQENQLRKKQIEAANGQAIKSINEEIAKDPGNVEKNQKLVDILKKMDQKS